MDKSFIGYPSIYSFNKAYSVPSTPYSSFTIEFDGTLAQHGKVIFIISIIQQYLIMNSETLCVNGKIRCEIPTTESD